MSSMSLTLPGPKYSGPAFVHDLNAIFQALASNRAGDTRPSDVQPSEMWVQTVSAASWLINIWDGTQDLLVATINPVAHTLTFPGGGVVVSPTDTSPGNLIDKLSAGANIALTRVNAGENEALVLAVTGLGGAATLDPGTTPGDLVQLGDDGKLPAINAEKLTGLVASQISGLPAASASLPVGAVIFRASSTVPAGYLECNGAAVSRATYAALFAAIGTAHGYGNNSTTFNLPDLRGRFVRGWDHAIARDPDRATRTAAATGGATGDAVGSVQTDQYASHAHTVPGADNTNNAYTYQCTAVKLQITQQVQTTSSGGSETRPVNINLMACIKY